MDNNSHPPTREDNLANALVAAIEAAGFPVSGPTDSRAAEAGEPVWVCNARAALAEPANVAARFARELFESTESYEALATDLEDGHRALSALLYLHHCVAEGPVCDDNKVDLSIYEDHVEKHIVGVLKEMPSFDLWRQYLISPLLDRERRSPQPTQG